jgi:hypothetical protein
MCTICVCRDIFASSFTYQCSSINEMHLNYKCTIPRLQDGLSKRCDGKPYLIWLLKNAQYSDMMSQACTSSGWKQ